MLAMWPTGGWGQGQHCSADAVYAPVCWLCAMAELHRLHAADVWTASRTPVLCASCYVMLCLRATATSAGMLLATPVWRSLHAATNGAQQLELATTSSSRRQRQSYWWCNRTLTRCTTLHHAAGAWPPSQMACPCLKTRSGRSGARASGRACTRSHPHSATGGGPEAPYTPASTMHMGRWLSHDAFCAT